MKPTKSGRTFCKIFSHRVVPLALLALCITLFIACGRNLLVIDFLDGKKSKPLPELTVTAPKFTAVAEVYTQPAAQSIIVTNNGKSKVTVKSVTVSPDTAFTIGGGGSTVSARSSIDTWTVQPKAALPQGDHMAIITVTCSGTGGTAAANAVVTFTVTTSAGAVLSVTAPTFSDEAEGYSRPSAKNITIANTGSAAATIPSGGVTVSDTAKFEIAGGSSPVYTVDAGSSITTWTVQPKDGLAAGTHMAIITVTYNGTAANAVVAFTVTKPGAAILSVTAPAFANVEEGYTTTRPTAEPITITNNGVSEATINRVTVSPNTAFTISGSDTTVPGGGGILNTRTVQPASALARGTHMAIITVMYNGGITASAVVTFTVVQPGVANLSVTAPTFADVEEGYTTQPAAKNITIANTGGAAATILSGGVTVSDTAKFTIGGSGPTVNAGGSINSWTVRPNALLPQGDHMAIITVTYSSTGGTATASAVVTFTVTKPAETRTLTVIAPAFDDVYTGYAQPAALSIIITNTGNSPVTIAATNGVTIDSTVNFTLAAGSYKVGAKGSIANWRVRPNAGLPAGTYTATITVTYNGTTGTTTATKDVTFTVMARERFVAVGINKVAYKDGGNGGWTWTALTGAWLSVTYGGGKFVAVGGGTYTTQPNTVATTTACAAYSYDGINWIAATLPPVATNVPWFSVTYGNGMFVAVGGDYGKNSCAAYSFDGSTWIATTLPASGRWWSVTYGKGRFVATMGGISTAYSDNGRIWTKVAITDVDWRSVTYGGDKFVAVGDTAGTRYRYSTDGTSWTTASLPVSGAWRSTYGGGVFVVVNSNSGGAYYSASGIASSWTVSSLGNGTWGPATYGNGRFVVMSFGNNRVAYSNDGATWSETTMPSANWTSVTYGVVEQ